MTKTANNESVVMEAGEIQRTLVRIAHQILEHNKGCENLALVGIVTRGDILAHRLASIIKEIEGVSVPVGSLDISFYRDDSVLHLSPQLQGTNILFSLEGKTIVLVDDVLYTGRTIRAALDALMDFGDLLKSSLPRLLIVGIVNFLLELISWEKTFPLLQVESVRLFLEEVDGESAVKISQVQPGQHVGSAPLGGANV